MRIAFVILLLLVPSTQAAEPLTADLLAQRLLDSEALYTVTDGLKPLSDGFWQTQFSDEKTSTPELDTARELLKKLPLGPNCEAGVHVFVTSFNRKKSATAFVVHRPSLQALVTRRADVFAPIGITANTTPQDVMDKIDRAPRSARWRAFGLAFGYPEYAIEFFVKAGEDQDATKKFVERDFLRLPTFGTDDGRFVYAVPKGHTRLVEDDFLRDRTQDIFVRYKAWRSVYREKHNLPATTLMQYWISPPSLPHSVNTCFDSSASSR